MSKVLPISGLLTEEPQVTYVITEQNLAIMFRMIEDSVRNVIREEMRLATEKPMNLEEAGKFLGRHPETIKQLARAQVIRGHKLKGCKEWQFFASELVEDLKADKK